MARSTVSPQRSPISAFGLMPAEITTMSQSSVLPSLKARPVTLSSPRISVVSFPRWTLTPIASMLALRMAPPWRIELHFHEMPGEMDDVHLAAVVEQAARRFQAEQAAADHGGAPAAAWPAP